LAAARGLGPRALIYPGSPIVPADWIVPVTGWPVVPESAIGLDSAIDLGLAIVREPEIDLGLAIVREPEIGQASPIDPAPATDQGLPIARASAAGPVRAVGHQRVKSATFSA
jgi:hypothetical protein